MASHVCILFLVQKYSARVFVCAYSFQIDPLYICLPFPVSPDFNLTQTYTHVAHHSFDRTP
jgi:hypothetical protein